MHKSFFMNYGRSVECCELIDIFYWFQFETSIDIFDTESVKLLLNLSICLLILQFMTFQGSSLLLLLKSVMDQKIMAFNP